MAFEETRLFLSRVLPWQAPDHAYMNIHWSFQGPGFAKPAWSGRACESVDECLNTIEWISRNATTRDLYVCLSSQREMELAVPKSGNGSYKKAVRGQRNAVAVRALWLDVDVTDGHHKDGYADAATAARAAVKFFVDAGLPRPTLSVQTGSGGLHFYWCLDTALDLETWQPLANALAEATRRFGFRADASVTVDVARIMRLPQTKHARSGALARMPIGIVLEHDYSVAQMTQALSPYMGARVFPLNPLTPKGKAAPGINAAMSGGITAPDFKINLDSVAQAGCGFIGDAIVNGGRDYANPLWNLTTLVATFGEGGRDDAHRMARGHATYDKDETDELYDRKVRERDDKDLGWPSCDTVAVNGCLACTTCKLRKPASRPLQFGRIVPPAAKITPGVAPALKPDAPDRALPDGYYRNQQDYIFKAKFNSKDRTMENVQVLSYPVTRGWVQSQPWVLHFNAKLGHSNDESKISVDFGTSNSADGFAKHMGDLGVSLNGADSRNFREFILSWQTKLQSVKGAVATAVPFGWHEDENKISGFAYGGRIWKKDGDRPSALPDVVLDKAYTPRGELQPWLDACKVITDLKTPGRDAFIAAAFGAPLVRLVGQNGLVVHVHSKSGFFKTTAMKTALAVWGHPKNSRQFLDDTANNTFNRMGMLNSLPIFWDEMTDDEKRQKYVNLVFRAESGREKGRMGSDLRLVRPGEWQTLLMSAANNSILDDIIRSNKTTNAGIYRAFEWQLEPVHSDLSSTSVDTLIDSLNSNFGQAGLLYAKFLGANYETITPEVVAARESIERMFKLEKEERFWGGTIAVIMMGAVFANRLGLTDIDVKALLAFLSTILAQMRENVADKPVHLDDPMALSNILQQFIADNQSRHFLRTNRIHINRGKPAPGSIKILNDISKIDGVRIQYAEDSKIMRVAATPFREWAAQRGYPAHSVVKAFKDEWKVVQTQARLAGGTSFVSTIEYCFDFDLTNPSLAKLMND